MRALERWEQAQPHKTAVVLPAHGLSFSYRDLWTDIRRRAAGLRAIGLDAGDRVAILLHNGPEYLLSWLGSECAGLITVNIDPGSAGDQLRHLLARSTPRLVLCDSGSRPAVEAVASDVPSLQWMCTVDSNEAREKASIKRVPASWLDGGSPMHPEPVDPTSTAAIRFTSGTTGPSKAVGFTESQMAVLGAQYVWLGQHGPDDRLYTPFPLYHALASACGVAAMLRIGASVALDDRFRATAFWERVGRAGASATQLLAALTGILLVQPEGPHDRDHGCQRAQWCPQNQQFAQRFGVTLTDVYGMSEAGFLAYAPPGETPRQGTVGQVGGLWDVKVVDERDAEVPLGVEGEIVCRPLSPHITMAGYFGDAEATVKAWRNLWYHTGDLGALDEQQNLRLVGRLGDQIRRKGTNIPAEPIELAAQAYSGVAVAAAIAVPSVLGESEIKLCVMTEGETPDLPDFIAFLADRLSPVMVPRYIEFRKSLPMGAGSKVQKSALRQEGTNGLTSNTFDVEQMLSKTRRL